MRSEYTRNLLSPQELELLEQTKAMLGHRKVAAEVVMKNYPDDRRPKLEFETLNAAIVAIDRVVYFYAF